MEIVLSICFKCLIAIVVLYLIWHDKLVGLFAGFVFLNMMQLAIPLGGQFFPPIFFSIPIGIAIIIIKFELPREMIKGEINSIHLLYKKIIVLLISLFLAIVLLNYFRSGVDIYFISKGINFNFFALSIVVPIFLFISFPYILKTQKNLKTMVIAITCGALLLLFDSILKWFGYSMGVIEFQGQAATIYRSVDYASKDVSTRFGQLSYTVFFLFPITIAFLKKKYLQYPIAICLLYMSLLSGGRVITTGLAIGFIFFLIFIDGRTQIIIKASISILLISLVLLFSLLDTLICFNKSKNSRTSLP